MRRRLNPSSASAPLARPIAISRSSGKWRNPPLAFLNPSVCTSVRPRPFVRWLSCWSRTRSPFLIGRWGTPRRRRRAQYSTVHKSGLTTAISPIYILYDGLSARQMVTETPRHGHPRDSERYKNKRTDADGTDARGRRANGRQNLLRKRQGNSSRG